jgi:hypothetical protein
MRNCEFQIWMSSCHKESCLPNHFGLRRRQTTTLKDVSASALRRMSVVNLQRSTAQTVEASIDEAIQRMKIAVLDSYDIISVFSTYWKSDDTGSAEDSSLFIETVSKLHDVQTCQRSLSDDAHMQVFSLGTEVLHQAAPQSGSRKLFILHYTG